MIEFEWDAEKARSNFRKHGIRFEEAALVFQDPYAVTEQDRVEAGEYRWQTIGHTAGRTVLLVVAHTIRDETEGTEIVRIISARRAQSKERRTYEEGKAG